MLNDHLNENLEQRNFWAGDFGDEFLNRMSPEWINNYKKDTGITYKEIFSEFFDSLNRKISILELGSNIGVNLGYLQELGFSNLTGVEINKKACQIGMKNNPKITFINSSIENFETKKPFDLVFTAGVLIHINPKTLNSILKKIIKISNQYIFGIEYFSEKLTEIPYRGHSQKLWKQNFPLAYLNLDSTLSKIKEKKIPYKNNNSVDVAYLLKKN